MAEIFESWYYVGNEMRLDGKWRGKGRKREGVGYLTMLSVTMLSYFYAPKN